MFFKSILRLGLLGICSYCFGLQAQGGQSLAYSSWVEVKRDSLPLALQQVFQAFDPEKPPQINQDLMLTKLIFKSNRAKLDPKCFPDLDILAAYLKQYQDWEIQLSGHTDNRGKARRNLALSEKRAKAVATYLTKKGLASERIKTQGFGATRPLASNGEETGRQLNQRIELRLIPLF